MQMLINDVIIRDARCCQMTCLQTKTTANSLLVLAVAVASKNSNTVACNGWNADTDEHQEISKSVAT